MHVLRLPLALCKREKYRLHNASERIRPPGAAALAPAACRGEGGWAVACRLVVAGARRRPGALSPLRETQPVVPHCAGEVRGVEERARAACGDGGGDGPARHGAGVASVGVAVARVAPG